MTFGSRMFPTHLVTRTRQPVYVRRNARYNQFEDKIINVFELYECHVHSSYTSLLYEITSQIINEPYTPPQTTTKHKFICVSVSKSSGDICEGKRNKLQSLNHKQGMRLNPIIVIVSFNQYGTCLESTKKGRLIRESAKLGLRGISNEW